MPNEGIDLRMEGDDPIRPTPEKVTAMNEQFDARVKAETDKRVAEVTSQHGEALTAATAEGQRLGALSTLGAMIEGNPGDTLEASQFRSKIQDMVLAIHGGSDKPPAEYVAEAMRLNEARIQALAANTPGDEGAALGEVRQEGTPGYATFAGAYMGALFSEVVRQGDKFDAETMTGAPELEYARTLIDKSVHAKAQFQQLSAEAGPRQRVVPFPLSMLRPDIQFAETRAEAVTAGAERRQPDYRRDALVPFFRPINVLSGLGVPQPIIDNDITLPRLSDSIAAGWLGETASISDDDLAVTALTTAPHRLGSRDSVTFMLLAGADAQFGHEALIISEMTRAHMQAKEQAVYYGTGASNQPTGLNAATNVNKPTSLAAAITYGDILTVINVLANMHLPVEMGAFAINPNTRQTLSLTQKFASGGATVLNDTGFREPGSGAADAGRFMGGPMGEMAGHPTWVTTHIPTSNTDHTDIFFGLWQYVWCIDYGTAFMTIDDVTEAHQGRTRLLMNTYHDVAVRFPQAFVIQNYDRSP